MGNRYIDDTYLNVSRGLVPNARAVRVFGFRSDISNSVEETIWQGEASDPYLLDTAQILDVDSDSNDDAGVEIRIEGLDGDYREISEIVTLGTEPVQTTQSFLRVLYSVVHDNQGAPLDGDVHVTYDDNEIAHIESSSNDNLNASYTIPAGKTGYFMYGEAGTGKGDDVELKFYVKNGNGIWRVQHIIEVFQSIYQYRPVFPIPIEEKTDIRIRATTDTSNCKASASFEILLIDNPV